jgi:sugar-phosphatase
MLEAVIFDMDGLLVDSEPVWRSVEIACFAQVGLTLTEDDCRQTKGLRIDEVIDYWYERTPWSGLSKAELVELIVDKMEDALSTDSVALAGVMHVIQTCHEAGLKLAIASSSQLRLIKAVVNCLNLEELIPVLCSAEFEEYGKPHPAVFLSAAKQLGVAPSRCLVFEDSLPGVIAAKAAKMKCVAVPEVHEMGDIRFNLADEVLTSMSDFQLHLSLHENLS